ncbi:hypothetical protein EYF80_026845 [Liparis tanakae]|uniref:Uncharacterized protein n=1 Tax=Liparis tanakae TaxID=230148 RepID=A0A4Z2HCF5_9TELE|nr:hypothetical protein EYF80_026845 [Liparis tanakae]
MAECYVLLNSTAGHTKEKALSRHPGKGDQFGYGGGHMARCLLLDSRLSISLAHGAHGRLMGHPHAGDLAGVEPRPVARMIAELSNGEGGLVIREREEHCLERLAVKHFTLKTYWK